MLGKRKRSRSNSAESTSNTRPTPLRLSRAPLTAANLQKLNAPMPPKSPHKSDGSRSPSKASSVVSGPHTKIVQLGVYGINVLGNTLRPAALEELVESLRQTPRGEASPNAKRITKVHRAAVQLGEEDGIKLLQDTLLVKGALEEGGFPLTMVCRKPNLSKAYVPMVEDEFLTQLYSPPEQPQPDTLVGYINRRVAQSMGTDAPFSQQEEGLAHQIAICHEAHFPFLICQWKSTRNGATHSQARPQCARDGAAIVNFLHWFYTLAYPCKEPTVEDSCHLSATCDLESVHIYIHWRNISREGRCAFEMDKVASAFLSEETSLAPVRRLVRNWLDYAVGIRLGRIKEALSALQTTCEAGKVVIQMPKPGLTNPIASALPPTPSTFSELSNSPCRPKAKRARTTDADEEVPRFLHGGPDQSAED